MNNTSLRILQTESSCGWGNQEARILIESLGMQSRGYSVELVCCAESVIASRAKDCGIPVTTLPIRKRNFQGLISARLLLSKRNVDIVHTHSSTDSWLMTLACRASIKRPKIVRTRHVGAPAKCKSASKWIYSKGADYVITTSLTIRNSLIINYGLSETCSSAIPTGVDLSHFQPMNQSTAREVVGFPAQRKLIGFVSGSQGQTEPEFLCEAIARLDRDDFDLLILGTGLDQTQIEKCVSNYELKNRTYVMESPEDLVPCLNSVNFAVLPACRKEAEQQLLRQTMSCGIPVFTTLDDHSEPITIDGKTSRLVFREDTESVANIINELLDDDRQCKSLGRNARETACEQFSLKSMLNQIEEVYQQLAVTRRAAA
ncbi:glycosyltransferase family 4 protein [Rubinisphaera italica]|uniref:D-inositol 3-phosphate glycosyltransferase n=1 Tax=Rubinisphaera italica TaxID=2527969 RepID=A0A5C5X923_9PLAN|nr:glycosyltransferase family 4 protein [Rubinisphaera italica]TWT59496.1 D-inositol 3-phosphate glycosyltransferase [Rubinisphaera italica]